MENQLEEFAAAVKSTTCQVMRDYGGAMTSLAPYAYAGGPKVGAGVTLAVGIANWAAKNNCEWDPDGQNTQQGSIYGCLESSGGLKVKYKRKTDENWRTSGFINLRNCTKVNRVEYTYRPNSTYKYWAQIFYINDSDGSEDTWTDFKSTDDYIYNIYPVNGVCDGSEIVEPPGGYQYTTNEGCTINVDMQSLIQDNNGNVGGLWRLTPADGQDIWTKKGGGIIGGCNFAPVFYYDGGGGGEPPRVYPIPIPAPDGGDWWKDLLKAALGSAAGNLLAEGIKSLLAPELEAASFTFVAPCDKKEDGTPAEVIYELPVQDYQSRVVSQQAVIMEILQQHLNWKTPICFGNEGKGDYRTISFVSEERSPDGNNRLRKRFRYRSQSGIELDGVVEHWKDFTFQAGPVCVQHRGSALGSPQVWAASAAEGKRVIQHAGREAGIDPDQVGEWTIGGSDNPRYGMPGTMRVNTKGGYYWISSRLGEDGRPLVVPL